jgi:molybdopterin synthase catalytic subunit
MSGAAMTAGDLHFSVHEGCIENTVAEMSVQLIGRHPEVGGVVTFDGRVRNHHNRRVVTALEYSVYPELARTEGERIVRKAGDRFGLAWVYVLHRVGPVPIGHMAVWVSTGGAHRDEAFAGCRAVIDEIKKTVPIWKHEWYEDGQDEWVLGTPVSDVVDPE